MAVHILGYKIICDYIDTKKTEYRRIIAYENKFNGFSVSKKYIS
jgi:hypothetical protein